MELYTSTKQDTEILRNDYIWNCLVYVLNPRLQDGKKIPKWDPKTRVGKYLGKSTKYARSVGLICNLQTGLISPQFHVLYTNNFQIAMEEYGDNNAVRNHI